ncbi:MAG: hypothetical protein KZQ99_08580 [Candidatus Thiodiazotropha sp. (ex Dulcina madagascariensis)]|nr:hypothetical protein [Candidatus Thiodiazotropha sp. (ex Dulcina madagascariensis)]
MSSPYGPLSPGGEIGGMSVETQVHHRTMAITHAEFLRSLQPLKQHYRYRVDDEGKRVVISDHRLSVEIRLGTERESELGALKMPSTRVELILRGEDSCETERFWSRFDLCFRRGGG